MIRATKLGANGKRIGYSKAEKMFEILDKTKICPACYLSVAKADNDAVKFDDQYYHKHCLMKHYPQDSDYDNVYGPLFKCYKDLEQAVNKSAEEELTLKDLRAVLFRNGICQK